MKGLFKIQKMFDNNIVELSTISNEEADRVNINKLKVYHHNNPPTNVIIMVVIVDTRPSGKIKNRYRKKTKLIFHLSCMPNQRIYPGLTQNLEKTFNEDNIEWIEEEDSRSDIPRMSKNVRARKLNYRGKKGTLSLYSRNYVNKEEGNIYIFKRSRI